MSKEKILVTVDAVIFTIADGELKALLIKRAGEPFEGYWALPGGFIGKHEYAEKAILRVLKEKTGLEHMYVEQLYTFDSTHRDPRGHVITVAYFALASIEKMEFGHGKDVQTPTLFSITKLPSLAFDHKDIVAYAVQRLRAKLEYTNVVYSLLPKEFALSELQRAYEIILGRTLDKRNFLKKFRALNLIKPTSEVRRAGRARPAQLYRFVSQKPSELKKFF